MPKKKATDSNDSSTQREPKRPRISDETINLRNQTKSMFPQDVKEEVHYQSDELNSDASEMDAEKECLAEKAVPCGEDYDDIKLDSFLDAAINSDLKTLQFDWSNECCLCLEHFDTYQQLLQHITANHLNNNTYSCVLANCTKKLSNEQLLCRHLILQHSDLQSLQIYGNCPNCGLSFSNFTHLNKHSCYRTLKRKAGMKNYCSVCKLQLCSFKRFVFHLQFHLPRRRPKICLICSEEFCDVNKFFEHVQYAHEENLFPCLSCDRTYTREVTFQAHCRTHKPSYRFQCSQCPKQYEHKHLLKMHMNKFHNSEWRKIECEICSKIFINEYSYEKHMKFHPSMADVQVFLCSTCGLLAADEEDLMEHVRQEDARCFGATICNEILTTAFTCEHCWSEFRSAEDLQAHRATGVHADNVYACPGCSENFDDLTKLCRHRKSHSAYKPQLMALPLSRLFMCNVENCTKAYAEWSYLYSHKKRGHTDRKNVSSQVVTLISNESLQEEPDEKFVCQFCNKNCLSKMSLAVHVARAHNNRNIICPSCSTSYRDEKSLQKHIDFMHEPIECSQCNKMIKNRKILRTHELVVHSKEHRFYCEVCGRGFYYKNEMEAHSKIKHAVASYKCPECAFSTNYAKSLDIHLAMHNNDLSYKCSLCGKGFARKYVLDVHMKRHHVKRSILCSQRIANGCAASFLTNALLKKHIEQAHDGLEDEKEQEVDDPDGYEMQFDADIEVANSL